MVRIVVLLSSGILLSPYGGPTAGETVTVKPSLRITISTLLGIATKIIIASHLDCPLEGTERLVEICRRVGADTYLSGSGGSKYQDEATFAEAGIKLAY
jgi:hypothetical protein